MAKLSFLSIIYFVKDSLLKISTTYEKYSNLVLN